MTQIVCDSATPHDAGVSSTPALLKPVNVRFVSWNLHYWTGDAAIRQEGARFTFQIPVHLYLREFADVGSAWGSDSRVSPSG
jgi:hypothetical protein